MAVTIERVDDPEPSMHSPSNQEWITRLTRLQEMLALCPTDVSARGELATLLERLDQPEEALFNWNAVLACNANDLKAREGAARCRRRTGRSLNR
mgnify:CR=1 FL=1